MEIRQKNPKRNRSSVLINNENDMGDEKREWSHMGNERINSPSKWLFWTDDRLFGQHQIIHCVFNGQEESLPENPGDSRYSQACSELNGCRSFMRSLHCPVFFIQLLGLCCSELLRWPVMCNLVFASMPECCIATSFRVTFLLLPTQPGEFTSS